MICGENLLPPSALRNSATISDLSLHFVLGGVAWICGRGEQRRRCGGVREGLRWHDRRFTPSATHRHCIQS